jgi:hypothetical protein
MRTQWVWPVLLAVAWPGWPEGRVGRSLPAQERLEYTVRWLGVGVVDATFELVSPASDDDHTVRVLRVVARTRALPSRIYRVENRYETVLDPSTGYPLRYEKECDEAKFQEFLQAEYDQERRRATYSLLHPAREWTQPLLGETHNLFTALYFVRGQDFGRTPTVSFLLDAKGVYWRATARRVRTLRVAGGRAWDVEVTFEQASAGDSPRQSDLLTDNLVQATAPLRLRILAATDGTDGKPLVTRMEYNARGFHLRAVLRGF